MADENRSAGTGAENPENKRVLVHADHVKVYFKGKEKKANAVRAVDDVSFDIMKGETFGVVGESGCGKSTLGRTLIRLIPATAGHIYLDGEDISGLKGGALKQMRKKAQIIFQDPSACLNPRRTVRQILMEPFEIHHMTGKLDVNARIEELLHLVGLDTYHLSRYPHELSGGQKQRIGIARALALEPELIICDEAVSALDVSVQAQVLNLLQEEDDAIALLPQPFVEVAKLLVPNLHVAIDVTKAWEEEVDGTAESVTTVTVVRKKFLEEHEQAVVEFLNMAKKSTEYCLENVDEAAEWTDEFETFLNPEIAKKAIPECNICTVTGKEMKEILSGFLQIIYDLNPDAVGGSMPDDDFYYIPPSGVDKVAP